MLVIMSIIDITEGMTSVSSDQLSKISLLIRLWSAYCLNLPQKVNTSFEKPNPIHSNFSSYLHVWENHCQQWHCCNECHSKYIKSELYCSRLIEIRKHSIVYCIVKQLVIYTLNIICILWSNRPTLTAAQWLFGRTVCCIKHNLSLRLQKHCQGRAVLICEVIVRQNRIRPDVLMWSSLGATKDSYCLPWSLSACRLGSEYTRFQLDPAPLIR